MYIAVKCICLRFTSNRNLQGFFHLHCSHDRRHFSKDAAGQGDVVLKPYSASRPALLATIGHEAKCAVNKVSSVRYTHIHRKASVISVKMTTFNQYRQKSIGLKFSVCLS